MKKFKIMINGFDTEKKVVGEDAISGEKRTLFVPAIYNADNAESAIDVFMHSNRQLGRSKIVAVEVHSYKISYELKGQRVHSNVRLYAASGDEAVSNFKKGYPSAGYAFLNSVKAEIVL